MVLTEEDFAGVAVEAAKTIDILDFVDLAKSIPFISIKHITWNRSIRGESLSTAAFGDGTSGKIALARVVIRTKQVLAAIRVYRDLMALETMFYPARSGLRTRL